MSLGAAIDTLIATIEARASAPADQSYTAALLAAGPARCAKKLGEEAVEAAIAAAQGNGGELTKEAADVLFHLLVLLKAGGVAPAAVAAELERRTGQSGLAEKARR
ncbi:MAG: phosphoribosyl-ATP diphosphatase [Caulobacterales bacterium]|jgi:phosphoribosyl-ATP pyrophosphohydrolase